MMKIQYMKLATGRSTSMINDETKLAPIYDGDVEEHASCVHGWFSSDP